MLQFERFENHTHTHLVLFFLSIGLTRGYRFRESAVKNIHEVFCRFCLMFLQYTSARTSSLFLSLRHEMMEQQTKFDRFVSLDRDRESPLRCKINVFCYERRMKGWLISTFAFTFCEILRHKTIPNQCAERGKKNGTKPWKPMERQNRVSHCCLFFVAIRAFKEDSRRSVQSYLQFQTWVNWLQTTYRL